MQDIQIHMGEKFKKELKKYAKTYKSIESDFSELKRIISKLPTGCKSKHWNILKEESEKYIIKTRMMCRSAKGSSFRVIYFYDGKKVELLFLKMYFKGKKEGEDQKRINTLWEEKSA